MNNLAKQISLYNKPLESQPKIKQLLAIYEELFKSIAQAKENFLNNNFEQKQKMIDKSCLIIETLHSCLDFESGKESAVALDKFYQDLYLRILYANANKDLDKLEVILSDVRTMIESWKDVEKQTSK